MILRLLLLEQLRPARGRLVKWGKVRRVFDRRLLKRRFFRIRQPLPTAMLLRHFRLAPTSTQKRNDLQPNRLRVRMKATTLFRRNKGGAVTRSEWRPLPHPCPRRLSQRRESILER